MPSVSGIMTLAVASLSVHATVVTAFLPNQLALTKNQPTPFRALPFQPKLKSALSLSVQDDGDKANHDKTKLTVALTRESGKNQKLKEAIANHPSTNLLADTLSFDLIEMPCVEHAVGPDIPSFVDMIGDN